MKPVVTKIQQTTFTDDKGNLTNGYTVFFKVGAQGPYNLNIAADQFSAAEVLKRTQAFASELAQIPMEG